MLLYLGPGVGVGTIVLVVLTLIVLVLSFALVLSRPIKKFFRYIKRHLGGSK